MVGKRSYPAVPRRARRLLVCRTSDRTWRRLVEGPHTCGRTCFPGTQGFIRYLTLYKAPALFSGLRTSSLEFNLVFAGPDDVELLVAHRLNLLREVHPELETKIVESEELTREWIRKRLAEGTLIGFLAKANDGKVAGSACIWLKDEQPRPTNPRMIAPYLMSMYTAPEFRRKGAARLIVQGALKWCKERGYERVSLHASEAGKPLYESLGFSPTTEMRAKL
jgi:GNAT superfamily N-acetyltransferase